MTDAFDAVAVKAEADRLRDEDAYKSAIDLYRQLLAEGVDDADIQFGLGQCLGKSYDFEGALTHLRRCYEAEPDRVLGANYYAYILERAGLYDEAGRWYRVALDNPVGGPEDLWTGSHYCWYLEKAGRDDDARAAYADFLRANPTYTWAVKRYALLLLRQGAIDHAEGVMKAAVERMPASPFPKLNLLEFMLLRGDSAGYQAALESLGPIDSLPLPVQVTANLFEWWRAPSAETLAAVEDKAAALPESVHRDFDDLSEALAAKGGDTKEWARLLQLLLK
jgi:tetratricopeptide (TPR) repeat protein